MCKDLFEIGPLEVENYDTIYKHTAKKIQDRHPKCQYNYLKLRQLSTPVFNHEYTEMLNMQTIIELTSAIIRKTKSKQRKTVTDTLKTVRDIVCNNGFIEDTLFPALKFGMGYTGAIYNKYTYIEDKNMVISSSQAVSTPSNFVLFDYSYSTLEAIALLISATLGINYFEVHKELNSTYSELEREVIGKIFIDCIHELDTAEEQEMFEFLIKKNELFYRTYTIITKEYEFLKGRHYPIPEFFTNIKSINQRERVLIKNRLDILKLRLLSIMIPVINSVIFSFSNHKKKFLPNNISGGLIFRSCSDVRIIIEEFAQIDSEPVLLTEYGAIFKPKKTIILTPEDLNDKYEI